MSNVIPFLRKGKKPHHRDGDETIAKDKTNAEIFQEVVEDILGDWQRHAIKNQLNEYVASKLPSHIRGPLGSDYVNDLNACAAVEQRIGMKISIFMPGCIPQNPIGWLVAFHRNNEIFSTPADMVSEANARALNILLYMNFEFHMKSLGRI